MADPVIYRGLLVAGGSVLVVIGARTIWSALRQPVGGDSTEEVQLEGRGSGRTAYLAGLGTNLGNAKAGVFAIWLLPAFAGGGFLPALGLGTCCSSGWSPAAAPQ